MGTVSGEMRAAVERAIAKGATRYSIAKGAGIDYSNLSRWLNDETDIRLSTVDGLAAHLGLVVVSLDSLPPDHPTRKSSGKKKK